ncbi:Photosystem II polypeptide [Carex littledalei]|uniref:Photosystem II 10 kDa polypeptide, chloroplastic n=1 Tax=Carex littledalei TaxID=544730 RepID=A0A833QPE0_9POAL|nr:Photosystem II polypeptide [Carex littledalei]
MASTMVSSLSLSTSSPVKARGQPALSRRSFFVVRASGGKKIKTDTPLGLSGDLSYDKDASGRKTKGKGVYQFVNKYGANVDGYSPIFTPETWSESGDTYVGGRTGLLIWAVTLAGILGGGALLVYSTSALAQ